MGALAGPFGRARRARNIDLDEDYQPYHAARADLLMRAGRLDEAIEAYDRAIEITTNSAERAFLIRQRQATKGA